MASVLRVELHMDGIKELLNDDAVIAFTADQADAVKVVADTLMPDGHGYTKDEHHTVIEGTTPKGNREVSVMTTSDMAKAMQAKHSTLTKALSAKAKFTKNASKNG